MAQHTPAPWFVHDFSEPPLSSDQPSPADVTVSCDHPATITVAFMGNAMTATLEEARANARLIAAAPDMLEALKLVRSAWESIPEDRQVPDELNDPGIWACVDAAIDRAEGRL